MFIRWVVGVHGEAWCFHWRPAHLQLSSGEEQHNQAELKWALGHLCVECRTRGGWARSACPHPGGSCPSSAGGNPCLTLQGLSSGGLRVSRFGISSKRTKGCTVQVLTSQ